MRREWTYRCYEHCERTLEKLGANDIQIDDIWATAILSTKDESDEGNYPYRMLQKDIVNQYKAFREV